MDSHQADIRGISPARPESKGGTGGCRHCGQPIPAVFRAHDARHCCEAHALAAMQADLLRELRESRESPYRELAEALVAALDLREHETAQHSKRVACHTLVLARHFTGNGGELAQIHWGALLHDIGKIGVPDRILYGTGPLADDDQALIRAHPDKGYAILKDVGFLHEAALMVLHHHERFDGAGYPRGLAGSAVPLGARLFAVVDALDAMTSDRTYRRGLSFDAAKAEIVAAAGSQFDPAVVEAFVVEEAMLRAMVAMKCPE